MKDGAVLCVACGYHLQLAKHVGGSTNGSNGVAKAAAPHANGHDAKGHAHVVAAGNTQDYIASLLGGHGPSYGNLPAEHQQTGVVHGANTLAGNGHTAPTVAENTAGRRRFKFAWPSWLTFGKQRAPAAIVGPQTFTRPQPGMPPQLASKPVIRVEGPTPATVETDPQLYMLPTILLVVGLLGIAWFIASRSAIPGVVIAPRVLLTVLLVGTVWNTLIMQVTGWLMDFDFGPLVMGFFRLFSLSVFTTGLSLAAIPLAALTGVPVGVWVGVAPVASFILFSMLFELDWLEALVLYAVMVFVAAVFQSFAFGMLHTAKSVQFNFGGPEEVVSPRQAERKGGDEEGEDEPVRASAPEIRNPEATTPAKGSADKKAEPTANSEPPKTEQPKADAPKAETPKENAAPANSDPPPKAASAAADAS
jgi:hypothetical protein